MPGNGRIVCFTQKQIMLRGSIGRDGDEGPASRTAVAHAQQGGTQEDTGCYMKYGSAARGEQSTRIIWTSKK